MCELNGDFDTVYVYERKTRKARKQHRCSACGTLVAPGETYESHFSVTEHGAFYEKQCSACTSISDAFAAMDGHGRPNPGSLAEVIVDCIDNSMDDTTELKGWLNAIRKRHGQTA